MIDAIAVVVPARDEAALIARCLRSVRAAARHPEVAGLATVVVVVSDVCTDVTSAIARSYGAQVLEVGFGCVGAARAAGVDVAVRGLRALGAQRIWIACTDADTVVPRDWLAAQRFAADAGWDAVAGIVRPGHSRRGSFGAFDAAYRARIVGSEHPHVHGANLGVSAAAYDRAGGFAPLSTGEDHALIRALEAVGARIRRDPTVSVRTSTRLTGRAPAGYAADLRAYAAARGKGQS